MRWGGGSGYELFGWAIGGPFGGYSRQPVGLQCIAGNLLFCAPVCSRLLTTLRACVRARACVGSCVRAYVCMCGRAPARVCDAQIIQISSNCEVQHLSPTAKRPHREF